MNILEEITNPNQLIISKLYKIELVPSSITDYELPDNIKSHSGIYEYLQMYGDDDFFRFRSRNDGSELHIINQGVDHPFAVPLNDYGIYLFDINDADYNYDADPIDVVINRVTTDIDNLNEALSVQNYKSVKNIPIELTRKITEYLGGKKRRCGRKSRKHKKTLRRNKRRNRKTKRRRR